MNLTPEALLTIIAALGPAFGVYAAIRADLARLHERLSQTIKVADKAHCRIDEYFQPPKE